jgi:transcriptional regulator with XRE-family HTH domain
MSKLRKFRTSQGLSQEALGKLVGVESPMICRIEKGQRTPSPALISKLIKVSRGVLKFEDFIK